MKNFRQMTATNLRLTLSASLFLTTLLGIGIFYFAYGQLQGVATSVSRTVVDASASEDSVQRLQELQRQLIEDKDIVKQAGSIVAQSQSYQYQDQVVSDLNKYAAEAGVTITNMDFSDTSTSAPSTGSKNSGSATAPKAPTAPQGVKSTSVAVTLETPLSYGDFLTFLRSIEDNLTKMQVQRISLSKGTGNDDEVSSDVLTIQVYVR